jgi:hypothetical protein
VLNNNIVKTFRGLIIINVVLYLCSLVLPFFDDAWLVERELDVLSYLGYGAMINLPSVVHWLILLTWFSAVIGMYFFIPLARLVFLILVCVSTILVIVSGMSVMTSVDAFLSDSGNIIDGVILAMAYLSSVAICFNNSSKGVDVCQD